MNQIIKQNLTLYTKEKHHLIAQSLQIQPSQNYPNSQIFEDFYSRKDQILYLSQA
ncbi:hypothetical protein pb186bvf_011481 [Paramecium bursaria]